MSYIPESVYELNSLLPSRVKVISSHLPGGDEEEYETLGQDSHVPAKIHTKHLLIMSQMHYHQANHFGDYNLLVCDTVYFDGQVPMSHRNILPTSSGSNGFTLHIKGVGSLLPWCCAFTDCGLTRQPPDMNGTCEYAEQADTDRWLTRVGPSACGMSRRSLNFTQTTSMLQILHGKLDLSRLFVCLLAVYLITTG
jgi:hypothetical protein